MTVTVHQLDCFLAVSRTLHFGQAAKSLRISPSGLSEQISKLEREVGHRLFQRESRAVSLTRHGAELVPLAERVTSAVLAIETWCSGTDNAALDIGMAVSNAQLRKVLAAVAEQLPGITCRLHPVGFAGAVPALRRRDIDCALVVQLEGARVPDGIYALELSTEDLAVVMPVSHRLAQKDSLAPEDLWGESLIAVAADQRPDAVEAEWYALIDPQLLARCRVLPLVNGPDEAMELVAAGVGLNIAGWSVTDSYRRPGLAFVPLHSEAKLRTLLFARDEPPPPALRAFADIARASSTSV